MTGLAIHGSVKKKTQMKMYYEMVAFNHADGTININLKQIANLIAKKWYKDFVIRYPNRVLQY